MIIFFSLKYIVSYIKVSSERMLHCSVTSHLKNFELYYGKTNKKNPNNNNKKLSLARV